MKEIHKKLVKDLEDFAMSHQSKLTEGDVYSIGLAMGIIQRITKDE